MKPFDIPLVLIMTALLLMLPHAAQAGAGHDHGEAAPSAAATAKPRFAASSELFELVGVLEGQTMTLYLDRFADNVPVPGARIELDMNGRTLLAEPKGEATYAVGLKADLPAGVHAITATVTVGQEVDLLVAELDAHEDTHEAAAGSSRSVLMLVAGAAGVLIAGGLGMWALRRRQSAAPLRVGGAA